MSIGAVFLLAAVAVFFCLTVGLALFPGQLPCGLMCLTLGVLLADYTIPAAKPPSRQ